MIKCAEVGEYFAAGDVFHHHVEIVVVLKTAVEDDNIRVLDHGDDFPLVLDVLDLV